MEFGGLDGKLMKSKNTKNLDNPDEIKWPPGSIIKEDWMWHYPNKTCELCGSSLHYKFIFWIDGCIQKECLNYWRSNG